jgi:hypothetical protein
LPHVNELKQRLNDIREAIEAKLPDIAATLTLSAKALAERRIKEQGFGFEYSNVLVPAWFLFGKELNGAGTTFLENHGVNTSTGAQGEGKKKRRKKKGDPDPGKFNKFTNWGEFREAQGLQDEYVDLSYSNKMWANMQVVKIEQSNGIVRALLGATNTESQNKMNWNRERYGDFIDKGLTDEDLDKTLPQVVLDELNNILGQFLPQG